MFAFKSVLSISNCLSPTGICLDKKILALGAPSLREMTALNSMFVQASVSSLFLILFIPVCMIINLESFSSGLYRSIACIFGAFSLLMDVFDDLPRSVTFNGPTSESPTKQTNDFLFVEGLLSVFLPSLTPYIVLLRYTCIILV